MVYYTWKNHVCGLCPSSDVSKETQRFGNWIQFPKRCVFRNIMQWAKSKNMILLYSYAFEFQFVS
jgi:hypothetical protein